MGNRQHLEWLLEGVESWNARRKREDFRPDFFGMNLVEEFVKHGALPFGGELPLRGANLRGAVLEGAELEKAYLEDADLLGASLVRTRLSGATFVNANLRGVELWGANLEEASLEGTDLRSIHLHQKEKKFKTLKYTDLTSTNGLLQSQLDRAIGDTGVILPTQLVHPEHWGAPGEEAFEDIEPHDSPAVPTEPFVFLSYAHADQPAAEALLALLKTENLPFWWDQYILGDGWRDQIADRLDEAKAVLTLWTDASTMSDSVREEAARAKGVGKLVHVRLDDAPLPYGFSEVQWIDLRQWDGTTNAPQFQKLILALRTKLDPPDVEEARDRRRAGSSVEAVRDGDQLALRNTPLNTPPPLNEPKLKQALLEALWVNAANLRALAEEDGQCPMRIGQVLDRFLATPKQDDPNWFILLASRNRVRDALIEVSDLKESNSTLFAGLKALLGEVDALEPHLNPTQPKPGTAEEKPVQLDPELPEARLADAAEKLAELGAELRSPDVRDGISEVSGDYLAETAEYGAEAAKDMNPDPAARDRNISRARNAIQKLTYGIETIVEKSSDKNMRAFLNDAAKKLPERLRPFAEWLASFFT